MADARYVELDGGQALRAAITIRDAVHPLGVQVKCGLHAGEVELRGSDTTSSPAPSSLSSTAANTR